MDIGGTYVRNLDEKNRFKVPAKLREALGTELRMMKSPDSDSDCIYVYSVDEWEALCEALKEKTDDTPEGRRVRRKILSKAVYGEVDKNGRYTLDVSLMEFAGIKDEICIVSNLNHTEIWSPKEWFGEDEALEETSLEGMKIPF